MPDPGMSQPPQLPPGEEQYNNALEAMGKDKADQWKLAEAGRLLRTGQVTPAQVDQYFGNAPPTPSPAATNAGAANTDRAVKANDGNNDFMADPARAVLTGMGLDQKGVDWYLNSVRQEQQRDDQGYLAARGSFASAKPELSSNDPGQFVSGIVDLGKGIGEFTQAGLQHAVSSVVGPVYSGIEPTYAANPDIGSTLEAGHNIGVKALGLAGPIGWLAKMAAGTPDYTNAHAISDTVGNILLMGAGGFGDVAKTTPGARQLALDEVRQGSLAELHESLGANAPQAVTQAMPKTTDFTAAVEQVGGPKVWQDPIAKKALTEDGQRIMSNLQQIWANTGRTPAELVAQAKTDPSFADELVSQDMFGRATAPKFASSAPRSPPLARDPTAVAPATQVPANQLTTALKPKPGTYYQNSAEAAEDMMARLEGSPDINGKPQISSAGAVGKYQIMPATARQYGFDPARLSDPAYNEMAAHAIITRLFKDYDGNMEAMAIAYNAGSGRARQWLNAGAGTRLEAVRDNTLKTGWRYEKVASTRDESFMKPETQEYVARARAMMKAPEKEPPPGSAPGTFEQPGQSGAAAKVEADQAEADKIDAEREVQATEQVRTDEDQNALDMEHIGATGSLSAKNAYEDMSTEDRVAETSRMFGEQPKDEEGLLGPKTGVKAWMARRIDRWVSNLTPARMADQELIDAGKLNRKKQLTMEDAFRNTASSDDRAAHILMKGPVRGSMVSPEGITYSTEGATIPKVLQFIYDAGSNTDRFFTRIASERVVNRLRLAVKRGIEGGKSAKKALADAPAMPMSPQLAYANMKDPELVKLDPAVEAWQELNRNKLQYGVDNGVISQRGFDTMQETDPTWLSFQKLANEPGRPTGTGGFGVSQPIKAMGEGHVDPVVDPIRGLEDDTRLIAKMADRNGARQHARALAEANPEVAAKWGWRKVGRASPNEDVVDKALREAGMNPKDITDDMRDAVAPFVMSRLEKDLPENQFHIYDDGKATVYSVANPDMARLFKSAGNAEEVSSIFKAGAAVAKFERGLQVADPAFATRVLGVMHPLQTWLFDKSVPHHFPLEELFKGWGDYFGKSDMYEAAKINGAFADHADQVQARWEQMNRAAMDGAPPGTIFQRPEGSMDGMRNTAQTPSEFRQWLTDSKLSPVVWSRAGRNLMSKMSEISRTGHYRMGIEAGLPPAKAAANARKAFLDFQEHASAQLAGQVSSIVNWQRAHILGEKQVWEGFANDTGNKWANGADTLTKIMVGMMAPSAGFQAMAMMQDAALPEDQQYRNIPQHLKDTMFITPQMPWGGRVMLPFPWGVTPVMMMQQRLLEGAFEGKFGDPGQAARWGDNVFWLDFLQSIVPPLIPSAVEPVADIITNHIWSSGQPLNSDSVMNRLPADRYTFSTSGVAKGLGKVIAPLTPNALQGFTTPIGIQHLIEGYAGAPGYLALKAADGTYNAATNTGRPVDMHDIPIVSWFNYTTPAFSGAHIEDFYSNYKDFQEQRGSFAFIRDEARGGTKVDLTSSDVNPEMVGANRVLGHVSAGLEIDRSIAYGIQNNAHMVGSEKNNYLKAVYAHAVVMSLYGNALMDVVRDRQTTDQQKESLAEAAQKLYEPRMEALQRQFPRGQ